MSTQPTQLSADDQQVKDFAGKVRAKYPGAYDDMPDYQLSKAIATKHPEYADMLPKSFSAPAPAGSEQERLGISAPNAAPMKAQTETQFEKDRTPDANSGFLQHVGGYLKSLVPQGPTTERQTALEALGGPVLQVGQSLVGVGKEALAAHKRVQGSPYTGAAGGIPYSAAAGLGTLVGARPEEMEKAAERGDVGGVAGEAVTPAALAVAPLGAEALGKGASAGITAMRESPTIRRIAPVAGRMAGTVIGAHVGGGFGALGGAELGEHVGNLLRGPEPMDVPAAREQMYNDLGKRAITRGKEQAAIDRQTAREGREQEANVRRVDRGQSQTPGTKPVIITPDQPLPPARTTLQSYPREALATMARRGDVGALRELTRNPGNVDINAIPNLRYIGLRPMGQ